jgi:hypothetical protein
MRLLLPRSETETETETENLIGFRLFHRPGLAGTFARSPKINQTETRGVIHTTTWRPDTERTRLHEHIAWRE